MRGDRDYLFFEASFGDVLRAQEEKMFAAIDAIEGNRLLNTNVEDWIKYFEQEYTIDVPKIKDDQITVDQGETEIDVSQDFDRAIFERDRPFYITGTRVTFYVPFDGDANLFRFSPSTHFLNPLQGEISGNELILTYSRTKLDAASLKSEFENQLAQIKQTIGNLATDSTSFNASLPVKIQDKVEARRKKLLADQGVMSELGFPLRHREGATQTYSVPITPKKLVQQPTSINSAPFKPEPTLTAQQYEDILSTLGNMALVLERSPKAFTTMEEEDLRQHFLVQLNGLYQGQATGETFNFEGKTDILLRSEGKNIFIAECKFWKGPEALKKTVDQLLGYASWRDTKTAILLFNRNKNLSSVLEKIPPVVKAHANFKREEEYKSETGFRYILSHRDDPNRELTVTIMTFEVPNE